MVSSRGKDARIQKGSGLTLSWVLEAPLLWWGCHFILRRDREEPLSLSRQDTYNSPECATTPSRAKGRMFQVGQGCQKFKYLEWALILDH